MEESLILRSQSNEIFNIIKDNELNPRDFLWKKEYSVVKAGLLVSRLIYKETDYFYQFDINDNFPYAYYCPGNETAFETSNNGSWEYQLNDFQSWIKNLKREIESPSLWDLLAQQEDLNIFVKDYIYVTDSFNVDETERIDRNIDEIKEFMIKFGQISEANQKIVIEELDYLKEAARRIRKKDWILVLAGTLLKFILDFLRDPNVIKEIVLLTNRLFTWISNSSQLIGN